MQSKVFKHILLPAATLVAEEKMKKEGQNSNLMRPSELPIYTPDNVSKTKKSDNSSSPGMIENAFSQARRQFTSIYGEVKAYQRVGEEYLEQTKDNADWLLKYLREEDNTTPKAGAIAIGGLTGLIFGLRGGLFKRTVYAATGAVAMAALCYPKEASEYTQIGVAEGKKYATIAYNFAYGDDEKKKEPEPEPEQVMHHEGEGECTCPEHQLTDKDAADIVEKTYAESDTRSCKCPLGACVGGAHDENCQAIPKIPCDQ